MRPYPTRFRCASTRPRNPAQNATSITSSASLQHAVEGSTRSSTAHRPSATTLASGGPAAADGFVLEEPLPPFLSPFSPLALSITSALVARVLSPVLLRRVAEIAANAAASGADSVGAPAELLRSEEHTS